MNYLDNKKLKELYNLNPNKIPHELKEITKRLPNKSGFRYIYPLWISGELEDRWISGAVLSKNLNRLGYNLQIYYDVLVLNIDDISKRPKCKCGSYLKFSSIPRGYLKYCSMECQVRYGLKGRIQSEETKRKRSERMKGKRNALGYHHTKEARDSMSKTRRSPESQQNPDSAKRLGCCEYAVGGGCLRRFRGVHLQLLRFQNSAGQRRGGKRLERHFSSPGKRRCISGYPELCPVDVPADGIRLPAISRLLRPSLPGVYPARDDRRKREDARSMAAHSEQLERCAEKRQPCKGRCL